RGSEQDGGLEDRESSAVEGVHSPRGARDRAGPRSHGREVRRRRTRQVGSAQEEVGEVAVGAPSEVVGVRPGRLPHTASASSWHTPTVCAAPALRSGSPIPWTLPAHGRRLRGLPSLDSVSLDSVSLDSVSLEPASLEPLSLEPVYLDSGFALAAAMAASARWMTRWLTWVATHNTTRIVAIGMD